MVAFFELLLFAAVAIGAIVVGRKNKSNIAANNSVRTGTIRCPSCGSPAYLQGQHWECPYCGDSGSR